MKSSQLATGQGGLKNDQKTQGSYQVPVTGGGMVQATPLKFCLNFRKQTIAVVYSLESKSKKTGTKAVKPRKYIHEVKVDFEGCKKSDLNAFDFSSTQERDRKPTKDEVLELSRKIVENEPVYLNTDVISRTQVLDLLNKLFENKYGSKPQSPRKQVHSGAAPGAPLLHAKPKDDDQISDEYDDDFDDLLDDKNNVVKQLDANKASDEKKASAPKSKDDDDDDNWDLDNDDWGDLDFMDDKKKNAKPSGNEEYKESQDKKRMNMFFGGAKDDDLDDIPDIGSNFPGIKNEDKFNQVMSSSKEGGGLLASIGLNKNDVKDNDSIDESYEDDPHKKSDLFDTSKDRGNQRNKLGAVESDEDDFDLGFNSDKKDKNEGGPLGNKSGSGEFADDNAAFEAELAAGMSDDDGPMTEDQQKAIFEQFDMIYQKDPELRKALEKSDVDNFSVMEKYQIIEAYMQGGAASLQIELEDDEDDEKVIMDMSEEEQEAIESQFAKLYSADPELQGALGQIENLTLLQKYQILVQYQRAGESSANLGNQSNDQYFSGDEMTEVIEHEGKRYRRVQIEGQDGDHLMDDDANIYTLDFEKIGQAGDSDEEDDEI